MIDEHARLLDDITVAEAGQSEAIAWCGRVLSDLGADVARLNPVEDSVDGQACYGEFLHAGKRRINGAEHVDILIYDDAGHSMLDELRQKNPRVVVVSVSDYGATGPAAETPASELTLQAEAGIVALHPTRNRPPVGAGVNFSEQVAGRWAAVGALMGLLSVDRGAPGTEIDVSRFESLISVLQYPWLMDQFPNTFAYPAPQTAVPGIERAKDGWVCVVAVSPQQWSGFKKLAADPRLDDPRFDAILERIRLIDEVRPLIEEFTQRHTVAELAAMGAANRVPMAPVNTPVTVRDFAPYAERDCIVRSADGRYAHPRNPFRIQAEVVEAASSTASMAAGTPQHPLRGLRVVEIASFQAGPLVGAHLAALGADVIRVESANRPDTLRFTGAPPTVDRFWELAGSFAGVNVDKRSVTAELSDPRGRAIIDKLIASSDVLVENYVPRVLDDRGLDFAGVKALQPNIVMTRMPAWGSTGQWRDQPGFTYTANAASGVSWMTGYQDDEALLTGTIIDPVAAIMATAATLAAIRRQRRTGQGAHIEVALCDVALQLSAPHIIAASEGQPVDRSANRRRGTAPQGIYRTADAQWVAISVASDEQWRALAGMSGLPDWASDARMNNLAERMRRHDELDMLLSKVSAEQHAAEFVSTLRGLGIPAARVDVGTELIEHPQLLARQRVYTLDHPTAGAAKYIGLPVRFSHAPTASANRAAPLFGEHTREVLEDLGFSAAEIDELSLAGALAKSPYGLPFAGERTQSP